jgi:hypothetical protein
MGFGEAADSRRTVVSVGARRAFEVGLGRLPGGGGAPAIGCCEGRSRGAMTGVAAARGKAAIAARGIGRETAIERERERAARLRREGGWKARGPGREKEISLVNASAARSSECARRHGRARVGGSIRSSWHELPSLLTRGSGADRHVDWTATVEVSWVVQLSCRVASRCGVWCVVW